MLVIIIIQQDTTDISNQTPLMNNISPMKGLNYHK